MTDKVGYQVRQFDTNPNRGESLLAHLAEPSANAAASEAFSIANAQSKGEGVVGNATAAQQRSLLFAHRDPVKAEWDTTSIAPAAVPAQARAAAAPVAAPVEEEAPAPVHRRSNRRAKAK